MTPNKLSLGNWEKEMDNERNRTGGYYHYWLVPFITKLLQNSFLEGQRELKGKLEGIKEAIQIQGERRDYEKRKNKLLRTL